LKKLAPVQNHGISAQKIADVGLDLLEPTRNYPVEEYESCFQEA
jgi:hypothetical protein